MPVGASITDPISGDTVGTTAVAQGTYEGDDGGAVVITCTAKNTTLNDNPAPVTASINTANSTWQATLTLMPCDGSAATGTYTISVSAGEVVIVTGIKVDALPPITVGDGVIEQTVRGRREMTFTGSYANGYGPSDGYYIKAYVTMGGQQISDRGRLVKMQGGQWVYSLCCAPRSKHAMLNIELWPINGSASGPRMRLAKKIQV